ncbi:N-acetylmuramoyl-L-alanine amidase [Streptomyces sp. BI20]|uniref:N-acetylmuramoyl-L-alanine amidase n=1 Tax=Streptomyces sp. BI20 TaxID=3403460 RepID=UPI003C731934
MLNDDSPPQPESASSISPDRPWFVRRATLTVALAALAPACLAGWMLANVVDDDNGGGGSTAIVGASSPGPAGGAGTGGDAKPSGAPAATTPPAPAPSTPAPGTATPKAGDTDTDPGANADPRGATPPAAAQPPAPAPGLPLSGRTVVVDPGHNLNNFSHGREINQLVNIGTGRKECDTTGTATNAGYKEAEFTMDVSRRVSELLRARGVKVLLTHTGERAWGPCIDERARIGNEAHADAVISIHADGSSAGNRGFHVILPALVKGGAADTSAIVGPSKNLGERIAGNFVRATGSAPANYLGGGTGIVTRDDLGGLNLSKQPKVFLECGNMRDAQDAGRLTDPQWRQKAAQGIADGLIGFLGG